MTIAEALERIQGIADDCGWEPAVLDRARVERVLTALVESEREACAHAVETREIPWCPDGRVVGLCEREKSLAAERVRARRG